MMRYAFRKKVGDHTVVREQVRECLELAWHFAMLGNDDWDMPLIQGPLRTFELSQIGLVVFVQSVHRFTIGLELHAEVGSMCTDVVVKLYRNLKQRGSLRVQFPLSAHEPGLRPTSILGTLEADRELFEWILPRAKARPITIGWNPLDKEGRPTWPEKFFHSTPLEEW